MQGVLSRDSFRRAALSGQKFFTVLSLHISNIYAKQKGIAKKLILTLRAIMISQQVDLVAGDFNGTPWRSRSRDNLSTIDEAFTDCALPLLPGPTPLWRRGSIPDNWADVCGFLKPPGSDRFWKVRMHGAFSIPRRTLGLRPTDQSCHDANWIDGCWLGFNTGTGEHIASNNAAVVAYRSIRKRNQEERWNREMLLGML